MGSVDWLLALVSTEGALEARTLGGSDTAIGTDWYEVSLTWTGWELTAMEGATAALVSVQVLVP